MSQIINIQYAYLISIKSIIIIIITDNNNTK